MKKPTEKELQERKAVNLARAVKEAGIGGSVRVLADVLREATAVKGSAPAQPKDVMRPELWDEDVTVTRCEYQPEVAAAQILRLQAYIESQAPAQGVERDKFGLREAALNVVDKAQDWRIGGRGTHHRLCLALDMFDAVEARQPPPPTAALGDS